MLSVDLLCHPDSTSPAVSRIEVSVSRSAADVLAVTYRLYGDLDCLRVPAWHSPASAERLWEHTCFEMFVSRPGASVYHELNFSPSGAWAAYGFARYREASPFAHASLVPQIAVRRDEGRFELDASIRLEGLSPDYASAPLVLGLSAVVEDREGGLSYWALAHPAAKPDFHHRDSFRLVITAISPSARSPG